MSTLKQHQLSDKDIEQSTRDFFTSSGPERLFRPVAYFDDRLDRIKVLVRDCSMLETRINAFLTIAEDNHPKAGESKYVGFTLKGIKHLCVTAGFPPTGPVRLTALLDAIVKQSPDFVVELCVNTVAKPIVNELDIDTVELQAA